MRLDLGPKVLNFAFSAKLGILGGREKYKNAEFICKNVTVGAPSRSV